MRYSTLMRPQHALLPLLLAAALVVGGKEEAPTPAILDEAVRHNEEGLTHLAAGRSNEAILALESAFALLPDESRLARNLAAALAASSTEARATGEWDTALRSLHRALELHPERLRYRVLRGRAYFERGRSGDLLSAAEDFRAVLERAPDYLDALVNLGQISYQERQLVEAIRLWTAALESRPADRDIRSRLERARRELAVEETYEEIRGSRWVIRFGPSVSRERAESVRQFCATAHDTLCARFDYHPERDTVVTLHSPAEFRSATRLHAWVIGLSDGSIRITVDATTRDADLRATIAHEYAHHLIRGIAPRTPAWLHEGLAQIAEGRDVARAEARLHLSPDPQDADLDLRILSEGDPRVVGRYYDIALVFTRFLEERRGESGVRELLRGLGEGLDLDTLLRRIYGGSRRELFAAWNAQRAGG